MPNFRHIASIRKAEILAEQYPCVICCKPLKFSEILRSFPAIDGSGHICPSCVEIYCGYPLKVDKAVNEVIDI